jgi:hypothetical protein
MTEEPRTYTKDEVYAAVNAGADLVLSDDLELDDGRDWSLVNLAANAMLSLLENPEMSLDDVIRANWQEEETVCKVCGDGIFQNGNGEWEHGEPPDEPHEPVPDPDGVVRMVRGWING